MIRANWHRCIARTLGVAAFLGAAQFAIAQSTLIQLTSFPTMSVADGNSKVTITAEVKDSSGRFVPDGTSVLFETNLGTVLTPVVQTVNGQARVVLQAPNQAGIATVTAKALSINSSPTQLVVEFVGSKAELSSAREFIEIVGPHKATYSMRQKMIQASGEEQGVVVRYKDVVIHADDIQLNVPNYELRARRAKVTIGRQVAEFDQFYMRMNERRGFGTTTYPSTSYEFRLNYPVMGVKFQQRDRRGLATLSASGLTPMDQPVPDSIFRFTSIVDSESLIAASKTVAFPRREVQFHKADIYVGAAKIMSIPMYALNLNTPSPVFTDQFLNVADNQISLNYPYYLSLRPGYHSLLRLQTGQRYGRGSAVDRGLYLNYELGWNRGDEMDGAFTFQGIGRGDWGVSARQFLRLSDTTSAAVQLDLPAHRSIFGSANINSQQKGYTMSMYANATTTLAGEPYRSQSVRASIDTDQRKVGKLPLSFSYGFTAGTGSFQSGFGRTSQTLYGVNTKFIVQPQAIDSMSRLDMDFEVGRFFGHNTLNGLTYSARAIYSRQFGNNSSAALTYMYVEDGFSSDFLGRQRLNLQSNFRFGRTSFGLQGSRSLDVDRFGYYADVRYRLNRDWRVAYAYTYDRYFGDTYLDWSVLLAYRVGWREFGVSWSQRNKRIGFQILGAVWD
ncbi:MAG: invasin domain 3-containing protein [Fimbriimonadaceae bacterium]